MTNLLNLNVFTSTKVSIPQVIRSHSHQLRDALFDQPPSDLLELDQSVDPEQNNHDILQMWMSNSGSCTCTHELPSWKSLAGALKNISFEQHDLIHGLRLYNGPLTMNTLLNFPVHKTVNIPREVGARYISFGTQLLQDATGGHLRALEREHNRNCESINYCILEEWLSGRAQSRPVTWATLVEVLIIIDMGELAKMIQDTYVKI
jgi:hypothetical protein